MKIKPAHRFFIAYFLGCIAAGLPYILVTAGFPETGVLYVLFFCLTMVAFTRNYIAFQKETLWMTIKNPTKEVDPWRDYPKPPAPVAPPKKK